MPYPDGRIAKKEQETLSEQHTIIQLISGHASSLASEAEEVDKRTNNNMKNILRKEV